MDVRRRLKRAALIFQRAHPSSDSGGRGSACAAPRLAHLELVEGPAEGSVIACYRFRRLVLLGACAALIGIGTVSAGQAGTADTDVDDDSGLDLPSGKVTDPDEIAPPDAQPRAHDAIPFPDAEPRDPDEIPPPEVKLPGD